MSISFIGDVSCLWRDICVWIIRYLNPKLVQTEVDSEENLSFLYLFHSGLAHLPPFLSLCRCLRGSGRSTNGKEKGQPLDHLPFPETGFRYYSLRSPSKWSGNNSLQRLQVVGSSLEVPFLYVTRVVFRSPVRLPLGFFKGWTSVDPSSERPERLICSLCRRRPEVSNRVLVI